MKEQDYIAFHAISLEDKTWMEQRFKESGLKACEFFFVNNFIWRRVYQLEVAQIYGCGVCRYKNNGVTIYSYPFGIGDRKKAIEKLWKICKIEKRKLCFYPIVEEQREELIAWFPGKFEIDTDRDDFDYIYTSEKLTQLKGKKLHGKRNHIARFKDTADWSYEPITQENRMECLKVAELWRERREKKWNSGMQQEMDALQDALEYFQELGLSGGMLRKAGEIVAFTIGEPLNSDTFVVHFEKALPDIQGAYSMINQQFVLHAGKGFSYINREEDMGDLGLRKAKLSYYPDILLKKYYAAESDIVFAHNGEKEQILKIWEKCFGDDEKNIRFYLENWFSQENMLVIHEDGKIVSMASFLPAELVFHGKLFSARYVYAVATLPEYRGRGYAAKILTHSQEKYRMPLFLQPESENLEEYYKKIGFISEFSGIRQEGEPKEQEKIVFEEFSSMLWLPEKEEFVEREDILNEADAVIYGCAKNSGRL